MAAMTHTYMSHVSSNDMHESCLSSRRVGPNTSGVTYMYTYVYKHIHICIYIYIKPWRQVCAELRRDVGVLSYFVCLPTHIELRRVSAHTH